MSQLSSTAGSVNRNTAPRGSLASVHKRPPWASMMDRQMEPFLQGSPPLAPADDLLDGATLVMSLAMSLKIPPAATTVHLHELPCDEGYVHRRRRL
jgi:hypothetical protein